MTRDMAVVHLLQSFDANVISSLGGSHDHKPEKKKQPSTQIYIMLLKRSAKRSTCHGCHCEGFV